MKYQKIIFALFLLAFFLFSIASEVWAYSVVVSEKSRGEYRDGLFVPSSVLYQYSFDINERTRKVRLLQARRLSDGFINSKIIDYDILSIEKKTKKGFSEKVIIFGKDFLGFYRETYTLGETFFEYCKASSDGFLLSSGDVSVSIALRKSA